MPKCYTTPKSTPQNSRGNKLIQSEATAHLHELISKPSGPTVQTESQGVKFPFVPVAKE